MESGLRVSGGNAALAMGVSVVDKEGVVSGSWCGV